MQAIQIHLVDTVPKLQEFLRDITAPAIRDGPLALDLEGNQLCRTGTLSTIQIALEHRNDVWVVDVTVLRESAFNSSIDDGTTLKTVLEGCRTKITYDARNDANALFFHYGINLTTVYDLQLLDVAYKQVTGQYCKYLTGFGKAMMAYQVADAYAWSKAKDAGTRKFAPELGGRSEIWDERPLDPQLLEYCARDVCAIFDLKVAMTGKLRIVLSASSFITYEQRVVNYSAERIRMAQRITHVGRSKVNALAPIGFWGC